MELIDGAFPLLRGIKATVDPVEAFTGVDAIIMVHFPSHRSIAFSVSLFNYYR